MASAEVAEGFVEALHRVLAYLVRERQRLRSSDAPQVELEANRKAIVALQMQLGRALGARYGSNEKAAAPDQEEAAADEPVELGPKGFFEFSTRFLDP